MPGRGNLVDKASGLSRFLRHPLLRVQASDDSCADLSSTNTGSALEHRHILAVNRNPARVLIHAKWWITGPSTFETNDQNFWALTSLVRRPFHWLV